MIYEKTDDFYTQKINITNVEESRFNFLENICKNKKVLHIGCADSMTFGIGHNLHIKLEKIASELHGMDTDVEEIKKLIEVSPGQYFTDFNSCNQNYDLVLAPEVLEHVYNAKKFLDQIFSLNFKELLITVPNILHYNKEMIQTDTCSTEIVHPDHKYWFSPYTLYNIIKPYIEEEKCIMFYLDKKSMVACLVKR